MVKRSQPTGVEMTAIGLPSKKKTKSAKKTQKNCYTIFKIKTNRKGH